jgi:hypothetical protein
MIGSFVAAMYRVGGNLRPNVSLDTGKVSSYTLYILTSNSFAHRCHRHLRSQLIYAQADDY